MGPAAAGEKLKLGCFNEFSEAKLIPKVVMLLIIMGVTFENVRESFIVFFFTKVNKRWVGGLGPGVGNFGKRWWVGGSRRAGERW